nr:hypothetical protein HUO10_006304 [Paraburkholderia busanensis]
MPNGKMLVRTNSTPNSVKQVHLKVLRFDELWSAYPDKENPFVDPATGEVPPYADNQCAIRMSIALHRVGIEMKSFRGAGQIRIDGKRTALRARELAEWLKLRPFAGLRTPEDVTGSNWQNAIRGRTGIIFFSGYWARSTDRREHPTGDHIDLWNEDSLTSPGLRGRILSFLRFRIGIAAAWYSDLGKSRQILFWDMQ